jgi:PAS domain S-box-containing protein
MILDANTRAEELLGRPRVEIIGMHHGQMHPPEESEKYRRMFLGHIEKKVAREVEGELVRKDGKKIPVAINASTMTIDGKHLILGIFRDITERRKAEDALRESEEQHRSLVEASSDGIVRFDIDGKILMVNRQCVRMCGYESPGEFPGRNIFEFIAPEDHERAAGNIRKLLDAGGTLLEEYTLLRKDGARFQAETNASVINNSEGKPNGFVVVVRDVTERRGLEKQLFHALKMEAVGRLAGGLAHDINNYLGAITGFSDLVKITHGKDKALAKRMDAIAETALRASSLIRQLLSFSRRQPTVPEVLNLNAVIEGMESMMGRLIGEDVKLATWRRTYHRDGERGIQRGGIRDPRFHETRKISDAGGLGHRHRHSGANQGEDLRAVLHHEGDGKRVRARAFDGLRHRETARWVHPGSQPARKGRRFQNIFPGV